MFIQNEYICRQIGRLTVLYQYDTQTVLRLLKRSNKSCLCQPEQKSTAMNLKILRSFKSSSGLKHSQTHKCPSMRGRQATNTEHYFTNYSNVFFTVRGKGKTLITVLRSLQGEPNIKHHEKSRRVCERHMKDDNNPPSA